MERSITRSATRSIATASGNLRNPPPCLTGGFTNITIGWGLAVTMGCYVAGRISGAHLNPAVTIAFAVFRDFSWRKVAPYILAQTAGAFLAAALVFWNYLPAFRAADPHLDHTAGIFTTFPAFPEVPSAGLLDQTIGTAVSRGEAAGPACISGSRTHQATLRARLLGRGLRGRP